MIVLKSWAASHVSCKSQGTWHQNRTICELRNLKRNLRKQGKKKKVLVRLLHVGNRACIKKSIVTNIQNLNLWFRYLTLADCSFM